ncbi:MAG: hypothetical protein A2729_05695 [Candidatus Buchananbacteria bacterium RIFCSPHIGHO2_01_FULL_39_14]|uniref:Uncharacterized protein n=2 Tax=Candidatus Buchananiibacteriota TaxID=1817903 RepID=A0A1G1YUN8_9BACT|nr:MAG: hypothetical protein A2729_05695 [Candidatus Buchananbacteria bacterium RIFCSPHIGHO2_01_FULL_39_14]OGY48460.1 MAG: hypothetical protein A3D39_02510 [Candidatus Buchananbacteria bacterium RIFCSPHIGHO2_02_FULL_39_17]OGY55300.1 MAG: hypothetical protein A2912_02575 [Candidatus Buchananbacteria bacterium RIFCSPLOWO2_01_FULL_40_23b]
MESNSKKTLKTEKDAQRFELVAETIKAIRCLITSNWDETRIVKALISSKVDLTVIAQALGSVNWPDDKVAQTLIEALWPGSEKTIVGQPVPQIQVAKTLKAIGWDNLRIILAIKASDTSLGNISLALALRELKMSDDVEVVKNLKAAGVQDSDLSKILEVLPWDDARIARAISA